MGDERLSDFKRVVLRNQEAPDDLRKLWLMQSSRSPDAEHSDPLDALGARLIVPGNPPALLSHSYLNDEDRANTDIMCNIAAFDVVFGMSTFVVELEDDSILGYWHGPEQTGLSEAAILQLDTEGQFSVLPGLTLTEAVMGRALEYHSEEDFNRFREWFAEYGIRISARSADGLAFREVKTDPRDVHIDAYNRKRMASGLDPV